MEQEQLDKEISLLEQQLRESIDAENFFQTNSGVLWQRLAQLEITRAVNDVTSDKYEKDHTGYIKRLADIQAYKTLLRKMHVAAAPARREKIIERLDVKQNG